MICKSVCCLLLGLMAFLVSCEEPRRKTEKQKKKEAYEKEQAKNISKGPFEDFRVYTSHDRSEKVTGRLVKKYSDGIVIERETDGKFFTILLSNLYRRDMLFIKNVKSVDGLAPMPSFISSRTNSIESLRRKDRALAEQLQNPGTGASMKRGLEKERFRIQKEIANLDAAVRAHLKGKNFIETPR